MHGNYHHEYMICKLEEAFHEKGIKTEMQVHVKSGDFVGFIDLVAEDESGTLLCIEVERETKRISNDYVKKELIGGESILWVIVPTSTVQKSARRFVQSMELSENDSFKVLTYGQALSGVKNLIPFSFRSLREEKENK